MLIGYGNTPQAHQEQPSYETATQRASNWELTEQTDEMDHSKTQVLSQRSSTSAAIIQIDCSSKRIANTPRGGVHFSGIYLMNTGPIASINAGRNGGKEQVRYKFEDDVVHQPFWFTGTDHDGFFVPDARLLEEMLRHKNMVIEFSPGATLAKFNLQGLSDAVTRIHCSIDKAKNGQGQQRSDDTVNDDPDVSIPQLISKVEPEYSDEARAANYSATVLLSVVIDEHGLPSDIRVTRPVGRGLDQKAADAVSQWRYRPGLKNGRAVAVQINVEVPFRLFP